MSRDDGGPKRGRGASEKPPPRRSQKLAEKLIKDPHVKKMYRDYVAGYASKKKPVRKRRRARRRR